MPYNMLATTSKDTRIEIRDQWFESFVNEITTHHLQIEQGVASKQLIDFYEKLIFGDVKDIADNSRKNSQKIFVKAIISKFLNQLKDLSKINKLAFHFNDSKVLVWAEVQDDDEATEDHLIMTQAKINADFSKYRFYLDTTIIEECDSLNIPEHYQIFKK